MDWLESNSAAMPATCGAAWLVPGNCGRATVAALSAPTKSGFRRPSTVGPRLLKDSMVWVLAWFDAPTASMPGLALSAGLFMLPCSVAVPSSSLPVVS